MIKTTAGKLALESSFRFVDQDGDVLIASCPTKKLLEIKCFDSDGSYLSVQGRRDMAKELGRFLLNLYGEMDD